MSRQVFVSTTYNEENESSLLDTVEVLAQEGFDGIELGSVHKETELASGEVNLLRRLNLVTHNFFPCHVDNQFVINIAAMDGHHRDASVNHAKYCLRVAADLGATTYTIHPGFVSTVSPGTGLASNYDFHVQGAWSNRQDAIDNMTASLESLLTLADDLGVVLAIETEGSVTKPGLCLMETPEEYDWLLKRLGKSNLRVNFNVAHSYFASVHYGFCYNQFVRKLHDLIVLVELSHNDGTADQHRALEEDSPVLLRCEELPPVPHILEFRRCKISQIRESKSILERYWGG